MNNIVTDIWKLILSRCNDREKLNFLLTSKKIIKLLEDHVHFNEEVDINKILKSQFFLNFTNLIMDEYIIYANSNLYGNKNNALVLPRDIKKLRFTDIFNRFVDNIPLTVTHLTFGDRFNQYINGCIPKSVTHLTFGFDYNKSLFNCIPSSVTHLTFQDNFINRNRTNIPTTVKHLKFVP